MEAKAETGVLSTLGENGEGKSQVAPPSLQEIADYIHLKESTEGKALKGLHITCKNKGLSNEYGYNPPVCYKDNQTVRLIVEDWIARHRAEGLTDDQLLRHYSNNGYGLN